VAALPSTASYQLTPFRRYKIEGPDEVVGILATFFGRHHVKDGDERLAKGEKGNGGRQLSAAPVVGPTVHGADDLPTEIIGLALQSPAALSSESLRPLHHPLRAEPDFGSQHVL
jgi:hypothetical protein